MNFSFLEHTKWRNILVIGKTIEREGKKYHMIGMTLSDEAKLYIIEPYTEPSKEGRKGIRNQRRILKEQKEIACCYLHCSDFYFGNEHLQIQGGTGGSLQYASDDYRTIQLFFDMMNAGWTVPDWLKETDWNDLQFVTLNIANAETLPPYSPKMPITIKHRPDPILHLLEKTVTLHIGKCHSFHFIDHLGDNVQCYINKVALIDVWKNTEEELCNLERTKRFSPEQLEQAKKHSYYALEQTCPKGMCYIGIEYECSKDFSLVFHSKQYLTSNPHSETFISKTQQKSSYFLMMHLKPDKEIGTHGLPLKGAVIQTPVSPDTWKVPAELFQYFEKVKEWTEIVL